MKRKALAVLIACGLLACPLSRAHSAREGTAGGTEAPAPAAASEAPKGIAPAPAAPVPPPVPNGAQGKWVQVPGESIGGRWVPPHWVWVSAVPAPVRGPVAYVPYPPPPAYALVPAPTFPSVLADLLVLRPIGLAGLVIGTGATIVAAPFALPSGSMDEVGRTLIGGPFDFTFKRPLGVW